MSFVGYMSAHHNHIFTKNIPSSSTIVTTADDELNMIPEGLSVELSKIGMVSSASQIKSSTTVILVHCRSSWFVGVIVILKEFSSM